ncbi:MAG: Holliday junction resolvase RuvX [Tissierellia bacterium]|nr:Holliday junction resolvase RuvX [Tissierellia bacterium]
MERIMGLDVGDKTIGVALSDPLMLTAQGLKTINRKNIKDDIEEIKRIIKKYNVVKVVIGFPKNMNNTVGPQGEKVLKFATTLENNIDIDVVLEDERLTTVSAERMLIKGDVSRENRKKVIDKVAATYILQTYLDRN